MNIHKILELLRVDSSALDLDLWQEAYLNISGPNADKIDPPLAPEQIQTICEWIGFRDELIIACVDTAKRVQKSPEAGELLKTAKYIVQNMSDDRRSHPSTNWPMILPDHWPSPSLFYVIVFLNCLPKMRELHKERNIPEAVTIATLLDIESKIDVFIRQNGYPGLNTFHWFADHFNCKIFQLGRLQFQFSDCYSLLNVFKHISKNEIAVLADSGLKFRPDGQYFDADNKVEPEESTKLSELIDAKDYWQGTPITDKGFALMDDLKLPKSDWQLVLKPGDPILNLHIPAGTPRNSALTREACAESFKWALDFFPKHFPEYKSKAFLCCTWMLDPSLVDYLSPTSNLAQFQNWFHLFPMLAAGDDPILRFLFGDNCNNWDEAQAMAKTSLQRSVVNHQKQGGKWRCQGGQILNEEITQNEKFTNIAH